MAEDNVFLMPTPLERLAGLIKQDLQHCERGILKTEEGRRQWKDAAYNLCLHLAEAKGHYPVTTEFGQWCDDNGFGSGALNHETRAAAIAMAKEPEELRACLEATERKSLLTVYREEFYRVRKTSKSEHGKEKPENKPRITKVRREMIDEVKQRLDAGEPVRKPELMAMFDAREKTIDRAILQARVEWEMKPSASMPPIEPLALTEMKPTTLQRYEATVRQAERQLREQIRNELFAEYDGFVRSYKARVEHADRIIANFKGLMSRRDFRTIVACLHPDHNTFAQAREAFELFKGLEEALVKPETPHRSGPPLPATMAELLARRKEWNSKK